MVSDASRSFRIVVVGSCASGKTTLVSGLRAAGYDAHVVAQEHSDVQSLWRRSAPDFVIVLSVSLNVVRLRRGESWLEAVYLRQQQRLADAMMNADLIIDTDDQTPDQVLSQAIDAITTRQRTKP